MPRVLPEALAARVDVGTWPVPPVFDVIAAGRRRRRAARCTASSTWASAWSSSSRPGRAAELVLDAIPAALVVGRVVERTRARRHPRHAADAPRAPGLGPGLERRGHPRRDRARAPATPTPCCSSATDRARRSSTSRRAFGVPVALIDPAGPPDARGPGTRRSLAALVASRADLVALAGFAAILGRPVVDALRRTGSSTSIPRCCRPSRA